MRPIKKELTLLDSTCLIVGIIIGVGVYQMSPAIAQGAGGGWQVLTIWLVGGLLTLCGAMTYAELATTYPHEGGDYVFLNKAYGPWAGFLFGWIQMTVVRPGDIAVMAFAVGMYGMTIYDPLNGASAEWSQTLYAAGTVLILTVINALGVRQGKWTQNLLTGIKALGLLAIVAVAFSAPAEAGTPLEPLQGLPLSLALIFVLFSFGGWNEMAYVSAEVQNPDRNIVRALVLGALSVTALYVLLNGAFLYTLGYAGLTRSEAVATDAIATVFPQVGSRLIALLICLSALGAVNGLIFAGARISFALGTDHPWFRLLGTWNAQRGVPTSALLVQGLIAVVIIVALRNFMEAVIYTAAPVYTFYLATSAALFVLRRKDPDSPRPYRVTLFPFTTLIFCVTCGYLIYSAVTYKPMIAAASCGILLLGAFVYFISPRSARKA